MLALLVAAPSVSAQDLPRTYNALYDVRANGIKIGEMVRTLRRDGDAYLLKTEMYTTGFIAVFRDDRMVERSLWRVVDGGTVPERYEFRQTGGRDRTERLEFDWAKGVVTSTKNGDVEEMTLQPGVQDKLAYQALLRFDLAAGRDSMEYEVAEAGRFRTYRFQVTGTERVKTPAGTFQTLRVERVRASDDDRKTVFWCAPDLDYVLVQFIQEEDGNAFLSQLLNIDYGTTPRTAAGR